MEILVTDCFLQIFSYLSFPDIFRLRTVSRRLKKEVEDYLPSVRSLPLYLTTPRTPEAIAKYENVCLSYANSELPRTVSSDWLSDDLCFRKLSFGTSGIAAFEDLTILQNQDHFRRSDFLILNSSLALFKFLPFIKKHCPNTEKLALVIDHCDHYLPEVGKFLDAFPALKVLLLESTLQDSCRHYDSATNESLLEELLVLLPEVETNLVRLPPRLYDSIQKLNHLEELYLFPKRQSQLMMACQTGSRQYRFMKALLGKLRVLHFNTRSSLRQLPVNRESEESLEELACPVKTSVILNNEHLFLPKLKKFIQFGRLWRRSNFSDSLPRPNLKVFDISNDEHEICQFSTRSLNSFTGLESFHCGRLSVVYDPLQEGTSKRMKMEDRYATEKVRGKLKNRTIKHLQIIESPETPEERNRDARRWSKYFVKLETCTFLEPEYQKIQISDLI